MTWTTRSLSGVVASLLLGAAPPPRSPPSMPDDPYLEDTQFGLDALEEKCGHFFESKGIDWRAVRKEILADAEKVHSDIDHFWLLTKLLARLEDGHAAVLLRGPTKDLDLRRGPEQTGVGMFFCKIGKKIYVKSSWNNARAAGVEPGMEVLQVDGDPVLPWLDALERRWRDEVSFSTDHQAFAFLCHQGLIAPVGTRRELVLKDEKGKRKNRTVQYEKATYAPWGPAFAPELQGDQDLGYAVLPADFADRKPARSRKDVRFGYLHVRRCPSDLPELVDRALESIGDVDGIVLDWRGNSGGGFDHDALFGRFVPAGKSLSFAKGYTSVGDHPYAGPVVVIVDATVRSAGETGSGIFKEDGRGYMIGETPTAGMSAQKVELELPSGLFALYVAVASNKGRFNGGRGIEGIGVIPLQTVEYDVDDLRQGRDTLLLKALELLDSSPWKEVPYDPEDFGWRS